MKNIILVSGVMLCSLFCFTSCEEEGMDNSIPANPVMTPVKAVIAEDGAETVQAVISDKTRTIELSLKNLKSLSSVNLRLSIARRAKLIAPSDTILTMDLSKPAEIVVNNLIKDITYTLTATIPEFSMANTGKHKACLLSNDSPAIEGNIDKLWDGQRMSKPEAYEEVGYGNYLCGDPNNAPSSFTFDIGETIKLYRFRASLYWAYTNVCPKRYELWGYLGDGAPAQSGDWKEWTKLGDIDNSNSKLTDFGEGDNLYFEKEKSPKVRYLRVRCLENYRGGGSTLFSLCEVNVWGYNM